MSDSDHSRRNFLFLAAVIGIVALLLREQFILLTQVESPIRGDIRQYVAYALNMVQHGVFSSALPGSEVIKPDAFRGPGYPLFLAANMSLAGTGTAAWYYLALHAQAVLGAATVVMGIALGRCWLPRSAALSSGLIMALWPHHIAATGALLSEVVFGFVLMLAMLLAAKAQRAPRIGTAVAAGAAFGFAYLINPVILFFPLIVAFFFWRSGHAKKAVCILAVSLLFAGAWAVRNATIPPDSSPGRATINLVQGSWPLYHDAYLDRFNNPIAKQIMETIDAEARMVSSDPARGLKLMAERMREYPAGYVHWYLVEKPYLLWDWDIRIGAGDVYFLTSSNSPLETNAVLHGVKELFRALNPFLFLLAIFSTAIILFRWLAGRSVELSSLLVAIFFVYVTVIHSIFQAEPRYSIPYRPFELLLAIGAISSLGAWLAARTWRADAVTTSRS